MSDYCNDPAGSPMTPPRPAPKGDAMALMALLCGSAALLSFMFGGSLLMGSLGIVFALLSRTDRMTSQARAGFIMSLVSLFFYILCVAVVFYTLSATGLLDGLIRDILAVDPASPNAYNDIFSVLQQYLTQLYGMITAPAGPAGALTGGGLV